MNFWNNFLDRLHPARKICREIRERGPSRVIRLDTEMLPHHRIREHEIRPQSLTMDRLWDFNKSGAISAEDFQAAAIAINLGGDGEEEFQKLVPKINWLKHETWIREE